jgi:hypothetical protein
MNQNQPATHPAQTGQAPPLTQPDDAQQMTRQNTEPALERVPQMGLLPALLETIQQVLFHPRATFEHVANPGNIRRPLLFALAMIVLVLLGGWSAYHLSQLVEFFGGWDLDLEASFFVRLYSWYFAILFLGTGFAYLTLRVLAPRQASLERTFRVYAYVLGSTHLLLLVPIFGPLLRDLWLVFSTVVALKAAHQVKLWHAIAAHVAAVGGCWLLYFHILA